MRYRKRVFIGLISLSLLIFFGLLIFSWHLIFNTSGTYQQIVTFIIISLLFLILFLMGFGIVGLVIALLREKSMPSFLQNLMLMAVNFLFPIALSLGKIFKIDKNIIRSSFIEVNNQLVKGKKLAVKPENIMILAPHCLQKSNCSYKITIDVNNCARCGKCPIDDLHTIADNYGVKFVVASGGTLARKFIERYRPKAVVAIACERDLTSGIKDCEPLPVLGVLNIRPEGPCFNTKVNMKAVEDAIKYFVEKQASDIPINLIQNNKSLN